MNPPTFQDPDLWYAQLPTFYIAVGALLTDGQDRPLLVKPHYRDQWTVPGGVVDHGEAPHHAVRREIAEETGLTVTTIRLAVIDLIPPRNKRPKPLLYFLFDCGNADPTRIRLQADELEQHTFADLDNFNQPLNKRVVTCIRRALDTRKNGGIVHLPDGQ